MAKIIGRLSLWGVGLDAPPVARARKGKILARLKPDEGGGRVALPSSSATRSSIEAGYDPAQVAWAELDAALRSGSEVGRDDRSRVGAGAKRA